MNQEATRNRTLKKNLISIILFTIIFCIAIGISISAVRPPSAPMEGESEYAEFSQMLANIKAISDTPHPVGGGNLAEVRNHILSELTEMGVPYEILESTGHVGQKMMTAPGANTEVAREEAEVSVFNILVKLDAPGTERGALFMAHYDSIPAGPGASDDATGVCAWLEAIRRHANNPNLQNDLYFLFTDGEEAGHLGSKAFIAEYTEFLDIIDVAVNLDAHGTSGGLLMFETSPNNHEAMRIFMAANSLPISYSWMSMLYQKIPAGTDLTEFLNAGYSGMNFAVIEGVENWNTANETFENLDHNTAYNFMRTAFDMTDYLASVPLEHTDSHSDGVYFTLWSGQFVLMSATAARMLSAVSILLSLLWLGSQVYQKKMKPRSLIMTGGLALSCIAIAVLVAQIIATAIDATKLFQLPNADGVQMNMPVFLAALIIAGGLMYVLFSKFCSKHEYPEIIGGLLLLLTLLTLSSAIFFNAASYLFFLPTFGLAIAGFLSGRKAAMTTIVILDAFLALLLYTPLCWLLYCALGLSALPFIVAFAAIPVILTRMSFGLQ